LLYGKILLKQRLQLKLIANLSDTLRWFEWSTRTASIKPAV